MVDILSPPPFAGRKGAYPSSNVDVAARLKPPLLITCQFDI